VNRVRQERNSSHSARRHYMLYLTISDTLALALANIATAWSCGRWMTG